MRFRQKTHRDKDGNIQCHTFDAENKHGRQVMEANISGVTLRAAKPKYALSDLLAKCNAATAAPADLATWDQMTPAGHEVI